MNGNKKGVLKVQSYEASQAMPVGGVTVIVSKTVDTGERLVRVMQTDMNGESEISELEAPPEENSLTPNNSEVYGKYNIRADFPGYYTAEYLDVPIFAGQTSIQRIPMIPLPEGDENGKEVVVVENEALVSGDWKGER